MKKLLSLSVMALLVLPAIAAISIGTGVDVGITTEEFAPRVWMCDHRVVYDDNTAPGRISVPGNGVCKDKDGYVIDAGANDEAACTSAGVCSGDSTTPKNQYPSSSSCTIQTNFVSNTFTPESLELIERINNYAFEGEKISWKVLVMDKNKIDQNIDVYATIGSSQGEGNDIEVNCQRLDSQPSDDTELTGDSHWGQCNARIQEENLKFNHDTMAIFKCTLTVETPLSMYGEYWITVEAQDGEGNLGTMDENEYWFLNPEIALDIQGELIFDDVRPGTDSYSDTLLIGNDADISSGVMLDMFISGTDFYDSSSSGARCPTTNQLALSNFRYYVTNGAYNSAMDANTDLVAGDVIQRNTDAEGYTNIDYGIGFNNPNPFYNNMEILQAQKVSPYYTANLLAPGAEMALTFKLSMPEPCTGDFDSGQFYFWGEAI